MGSACSPCKSNNEPPGRPESIPSHRTLPPLPDTATTSRATQTTSVRTSSTTTSTPAIAAPVVSKVTNQINDVDDREMRQMQNYFHICCLVMKVGTDACKEVFRVKCLKEIPLPEWIANNKETLKVASRTRWGITLKKLLERKDADEIDEDTMDLTLIASLINVFLKTVSELQLPQLEDLNDNDRSWKANITRLRGARNSLAHNYQLSLSDETYEKEKANVRLILTDLGIDEEVVTSVIRIPLRQVESSLIDFRTSIKLYAHDFEVENLGEESNELPEFIYSTMTLVVNTGSAVQRETAIKNATEMLTRAVNERTRARVDDGFIEPIPPQMLSIDDRHRLIIVFDFRWNGWRVFKVIPADLKPATMSNTVESQTDAVATQIHVKALKKPKSTQTDKKITESPPPSPSKQRLIEVVDVNRRSNVDDSLLVTARFEADPAHRANRKDMSNTSKTLKVDTRKQQVPARLRIRKPIPPDLLPQMRKIRVPWDIPAKLRDRAVL